MWCQIQSGSELNLFPKNLIKERVGNLHCFEIRICIDFVSDGVIGFLNSLARGLGERTEQREPRKRELLTW